MLLLLLLMSRSRSRRSWSSRVVLSASLAAATKNFKWLVLVYGAPNGHTFREARPRPVQATKTCTHVLHDSSSTTGFWVWDPCCRLIK